MLIDDKLKKALLWVYIAQYVRRHMDGKPAGVFEGDCKRYCLECEYPLKNGSEYSEYIEHSRRRDLIFIKATEKGTLEGQHIVNELLLQHNDELQKLLKSIPPRLLAFFVKEVFPSYHSADGLLIRSDYGWGRFDLDGDGEHLCILKDKTIRGKRNQFLDRLVELGLAVKDIRTYSIGKEDSDIPYPSGGDRVYCIAPEVMDILKDYISKNFQEKLFNGWEKYHSQCHSNKDDYEVDVKPLNPLVDYLLEEQVEPKQSPEPNPILPDLYFQKNTWNVFYNFLSSAKSSINICADTITGDALSNILYHPLHGKDILKNTRIMARSIQGIKEILDLGIQKENITRCKRLHAKFIIKDKNALLVTSCNITLGALGDMNKRLGSFEASIITEDKDCVNKAQLLFDGIWNEEISLNLEDNNSLFISSYYGIPSKIEKLIKEAKNEVVIAVPPLFERITEGRKTIITYIRELNPDVSFTIYTSNSIPESSWGCYQRIKNQDINLKLASELLHAKVYLFDDKTAFISSLNLSYASWIESVEVGFLSKDADHIRKIKEVLSNFKIADDAEVKKPSDSDVPDHPSDEDIRKIEIKFKPEGKKTTYPYLIIDKPPSPTVGEGRGNNETGLIPEPTRLCHPPSSPPLVISGKGYCRKGKGFSFSELSEAGLRLKIKTKKLSLPIDKRRGTSHEINIENLKKASRFL